MPGYVWHHQIGKRHEQQEQSRAKTQSFKSSSRSIPDLVRGPFKTFIGAIRFPVFQAFHDLAQFQSFSG